jgi:PadR family transcriptional regulator, regulatory protein PadR
MRADALKGHLDMLLLAVLDEAPAHGYLVIERLREASGRAFDLSEGTVYPALHRLERSGVLESSWDEASPRRRRIYAVTGKGRTALAERRAEWHGFAAAVGRVAGVSHA